MDIVDRIFELVDAQFKEQKDFAAAVGVSDDTASDWRRRKSASCTKSKYLTKIAETLNTTTEYLLTGTGAKTKDPAGQEASEVKQEFMELFSRLSPEEQAREIAYLRERVNGSNK